MAKTLVPNAGGPGVIPGQGTRSSMPQVRLEMLKLKIPHATTKMLCHNNPACAITKDLVQPNKLIKLNWEKKKKKNRLVVAKGAGWAKRVNVVTKYKLPVLKISQSWEYSIQHGDYS